VSGEANDHENLWKTARHKESMGYTVIQGDPYLLLLDFDTPEQVEQYKKMLPHLENNFVVVRKEFWDSSTKGHIHGVIQLGHSQSASERLALECALGSDPKRTLLGVNRLNNDFDEPSYLFQPPNAVVRSTAYAGEEEEDVWPF
jgi:hypothetical protein